MAAPSSIFWVSSFHVLAALGSSGCCGVDSVVVRHPISRRLHRSFEALYLAGLWDVTSLDLGLRIAPSSLVMSYQCSSAESLLPRQDYPASGE